MSQFVVGQWVECVDNNGAEGCLKLGSFYRVTDVSAGEHFAWVDGFAFEFAANRFRPVEWQVGRTYKTTLDGVTATVSAIRSGVVESSPPHWLHPVESIRGVNFDEITGRLRGFENRNDVPHLTPYLADEPTPPVETTETGVEKCVGRFLIVSDEDNPTLFGVRDTHEMNTAWVRSMGNAQRVLEDARAGKKHLWYWAKDVASEPSRYHRTINGVTIDLYDVAEAYGIDSHRIFHAVKKLVMAGRRGHKDREQDLREAIVSIESELKKMKGGAS